MDLWLAADQPFFGGPGQGPRQIIELFVAFGLTALIGLEREIQGKSAGVRTQTIVGTAAALDPARQQVRLHRRAAGRPRRRRPVPCGGPNRLGHRLSRRGHHHLPPRIGARAHHGGRRVGVRGHRHGRRLRPDSARRHGHGDALSHHRRVHAAGEAAVGPAQRVGHHARHLRRGPWRHESPTAGV